MRRLEVLPGTAASSSTVVVLAGLPRFRPSIALTFVAVFVADLFAVSLAEPLIVLLAGLTGVDFPLIELLVERGAAATASEVLLGLDDDAVGSTTFFCLFVAAVLVASVAVFTLRLAGAMISTVLDGIVSKIVTVRFDSDQIHKCDFRAYGANG